MCSFLMSFYCRLWIFMVYFHLLKLSWFSSIHSSCFLKIHKIQFLLDWSLFCFSVELNENTIYFFNFVLFSFFLQMNADCINLLKYLGASTPILLVTRGAYRNSCQNSRLHSSTIDIWEVGGENSETVLHSLPFQL